MRIQSFQVTGFANFAEPLILGPLDDVNVLYGPNNVGKSNVLRALETFLRVLGAGEAVTRPQVELLDRPDEAMSTALAAAFNRSNPVPVIFEVVWRLNEADLEAYGIFPERPCGRVAVTLELRPLSRTVECRVLKWMLNDLDISTMDRGKDAAVIGFGQQLRRLLADARPFQFEKPVLPCTRVGDTPGFPQALRDALFDARQSLQPEARKRWTLFAELASTLSGELGAGQWETTFSRATGKADLIYLQEDCPMVLEAMSAGVQRFVSLLGQLALANESYVCLEEPEWRLSPELQKRFLKLARRVLRAGVGPRQLFITSHSPVVVAEGTPFALQLVNGVPAAEQRRWSEGGSLPDGPDEETEVLNGLNGLIGLVETLAELDPDDLMAEKMSEAAPVLSGAGSGGDWNRTPLRHLKTA